MAENIKKILIVEDDRLSAEYLKEILEENDYIISGIVSTANDAIVYAKEQKPDLILMDIILQGAKTGCEAAVNIKQNQKNCKIIFLTAHAEKEMIDYANRSKANAYLLKPYRDEEILATISVIFSQDSKPQVKELESVELAKGFTYDFITRQLYKNGKQVPLNGQKQKLIELLVKNLNRIVSNEQICQVVWGESKNDSTMRSLIYRTKQAIEADLIHNSNGVGYIIRTS